MAFHVFKEKEVRDAMRRKLPFRKKSGKRSGHVTGFVEVDEIMVAHVTLPNPHAKEFGPNKAKRAASQMRLSPVQYKDFVSCKMSKEEYITHIRQTHLIDEQGTL